MSPVCFHIGHIYVHLCWFVPTLTVGALLMELLFASLAAAAHGRPPGGRALARVQLPRAVARHGPILLGGQPPVVSTATETDREREKRGGGALSA